MNFVVIMLVFLSAINLSAGTASINCDTQNNLLNFSTSGSGSLNFATEAGDCATCREANLSPIDLNNVNAILRTTQSSTKIKITYPFAGPNKQIQSPNYEKDSLKKMIEIALQNGLDPYLLISINLIESPPLTPSGQGYDAGYGDLPIDGLPVYDMLGCIYKKPRNNSYAYASADQIAEFSPLFQQMEVYKNNLKPLDAVQRKFSDFVKAESPGLFGDDIYKLKQKLVADYKKGCPIQGVKKSISDRYCAEPETRKALEAFIGFWDLSNKADNRLRTFTPLQSTELQVRLDPRNVRTGVVPNAPVPHFQLPSGNGTKATYMCEEPRVYRHGQPSMFSESNSVVAGSCCVKLTGLPETSINLKKDFLNFMAAKFVKNKISPSRGELNTIMRDIQTYNGLGTVGKTEGFGNNCLEGMNFGQQPYYGARVADLMLNSVMPNKEIYALVQTMSQTLKKSTPSLFCQKLGAGPHAMSSSQFFDQQRAFLLNGSAARRSNCSRFFK
jgi:hypothetical protein